MSTFEPGRIRRGLPRTPGGAAWPDVAGAVVAETGSVAAAPAVAAPAAAPAVVSPAAGASTAVTPDVVTTVTPTAAPAHNAVKSEISLRQGLPRVPGGDPWPPTGTAPAAIARQPAPAEVIAASIAEDDTVLVAAAADHAATSSRAAAAVTPTSTNSQRDIAGSAQLVAEEVTLRRGLPRIPGGEPWPPAGTVLVKRAVTQQPTNQESAASPMAAQAPESVSTQVAPAPPVQAPAQAAAQDRVQASVQTPTQTPAQTPATRSSAAAAEAPAAAPATPAHVTPPREAVMIRGRALSEWVKLALLWGAGAILAAGIIVLAARGLTTFQIVRDFLARYPGEYPLPAFVDPGFPAWVRWSHFLNFFLMVLIIRSGLLVRQQQKPDAFFTPKKGGKKISIYLWLHTSLDLLWLLNGVIFIVLLFVSGHWARIVPTSWEVFPNALSAGLQYLTLEWPHEDGWVNYNSLQQLMYFTVVFIAAPLAAITGVRMSEWWPKDADGLNKFYPAPLARAIHYPVMLFFTLFIIVHVFLVFATGALKNLNHMFVGTPEPSWLGFWLFAAGLLVTAAVSWAARPLVLAPIAGVFGKVSER